MVALGNWNNPPNAQRDKAVTGTLMLAFLAACAPVLAQTNYGTITFTNKSGDVISNAVVTKVEAGKLTYRYSVGVGGGVVPLADLPVGLRALFGYSPDGADHAAPLQQPAQPTEADHKKFEETKAKAEKGDAQAQADLGHCYYDGEGVTKDVVEASKWYRKAAEQGNARGENGLGVCYLFGYGVTKDVVEAVKWIRRAVEQGDARGETSLGFCYDNGYGVTRDVVEAVKWYRKAAEQRYATAQFDLGICYYDGNGVTKDAVEAIRWYRKAAEQELAQAQCKLGSCYYNGAGVAKDPVEAVKWYRKAAEQGFAQAQCSLGDCYRDGDGVTKNAVEAVKWYRKAAEQGDTDAQDELKALEQEPAKASGSSNRPAQPTEGDRKFFEKTKAKAEKGDAKAQCLLAKCYYVGNGVTEDLVEAVKWFREAAEQGFAEAQCELGHCYYVGAGVTKDDVERVKWYRKAAEQGYAEAQCNLGECYYLGQGVTADNVEAMKWYRKAAAQGFAKAEALANLIEPNALAQTPAKASASSSRPDLETLSLTTKVMEKNDTWWRWSYQLKVRNNTDQAIHEFPHLRFLDADGFIIQDKTCEVKLSARETKTVLGTTLVELPGAARVKTVKVE